MSELQCEGWQQVPCRKGSKYRARNPRCPRRPELMAFDHAQGDHLTKSPEERCSDGRIVIFEKIRSRNIDTNDLIDIPGYLSRGDIP